MRRGLAAKVTPIVAGAAAETQALEMAATFSYLVDQLRAELVEQPFVAIAYATREDSDRSACCADLGPLVRVPGRRGGPGGSGERLLGHDPRRDRARGGVPARPPGQRGGAPMTRRDMATPQDKATWGRGSTNCSRTGQKAV